MKKGFTLVEIMIVVAILGLLIAIGVPGFLQARNRSRNSAERANLKAISDNIASYGVNETRAVDTVIRLWPTVSTTADANSYVRKQLICPITKVPYSVSNDVSMGSCSNHGTESTLPSYFGS